MRPSGTRWLRPLRFSAALLLLAPTPGCVSAEAYDAISEERDQLREDKERLEGASQGADKARVQALGQAEDMREERDRLALEVKQLSKRVSELESALADHERAREADASRTAASRARWGPVLAELDPEVRAGQVRVVERPEGLQVVVAEELLFAPGAGDLTAGGRTLVGRLALRVRDEDQRVEVEGGADAPPLRLARGAAVMRALAAAGVPNEQLRAASFTADEAGAEPALPARLGVEIRLLPNLGAGPGIPGAAPVLAPAAPAPASAIAPRP